MKLLPCFIYRRFENRPALLKIINNISWLFFDKVLRLGVGVFVGVWIARYLGPQKFGQLNFAIAFIALFSSLSTLGLSGIVVRDIVQNPSCKEETLGTTALLLLVGGFLSYILALGCIYLVKPNDLIARTLVTIVGSVLLTRVSDIAVYWFESQVLSKYTVWVQSTAFFFSIGIKVLLILNNAPLILFAWVVFLEAAIVAFALLVVMEVYGPSIRQLRISFKRAKALLLDSWPLLLAGISVTIYMRIDQIMLGYMLSDNAVGIYSVAVRISEVWYFIPVVIVASFFPSIIKAKNKSEKLYYDRIQKLFDLMVWLSVLVALPMTFSSTVLIKSVFGLPYIEAGLILSIHVWASIFVFIGVASAKWILVENYQVLIFQRSMLGAIVNVGLNCWLIPLYGLVGAAVATVLAQASAAWFFDLYHEETRPIFFMKLASMNPLKIFYFFKVTK